MLGQRRARTHCNTVSAMTMSGLQAQMLGILFKTRERWLTLVLP